MHLASVRDKASKALLETRFDVGLDLRGKSGWDHRVCADCRLLVRNVSRVGPNAKHIHVAAAASAVPGRSGNSAKLAAYGGTSVVFEWTISGR